MALLTIEMIDEIRKVVDLYKLSEAIRLAKIEARETFGIDWHNLEEISKFELVLAILGAENE